MGVAAVAERARKGAPDETKIRPRIGRWEIASDGEVELIGTRCTACGELMFPEHSPCAACGSPLTEEARLRGPATLRSYTIVHQLPPGFTAPQAVGYGELDGRIQVLAPIDAPAGGLKDGLRLSLHIGPTWIDDNGEPMMSYWYKPHA